MLLAGTPITNHSFCVIPKPERSTENSAELSLPLVHNPSSAGLAPNLVTVRVNCYFLSTMSASNTEVHCCTTYTTQNSLCALKIRLCCAHCSQEGAGISGTSPQEEEVAELWWKLLLQSFHMRPGWRGTRMIHSTDPLPGHGAAGSCVCVISVIPSKASCSPGS